MSNFSSLSPLMEGPCGTAPNLFIASTADNLGTITTAGYLNDIYKFFKANDLVYVNYSDTSTFPLNPGEAATFGYFKVIVSGGDTSLQATAPAGSLLAANNLSDVGSVATSRTNLGLGTGDSPSFAGLALTGLMAVDAANAITAFAGGGQGSATALTKAISRVTTVATAADSVKLPAATAGKWVVVVNAAAANAMAVFPATGEIINALSANASISVAANKVIVFFCAVAGTWNSLLTA